MTCNICTKICQTQRQLNIHIKTLHGHGGQKNFKCGSCGKLFSQVGNLKNHLYTIHEGHKDHKCELCGKSFFNVGDLNLVVNHFLKQEI